MAEVSGSEINAKSVCRGIRPTQERLHAGPGTKRADLTVLVIAETIESPGGLAELVIKPVGCFHFTERLSDSGRPWKKRPRCEHRILQILPVTLCIDKPEQLVFDERSAKISSELLPFPTWLTPWRTGGGQVASRQTSAGVTIAVVAKQF